MLVFIAMQAFSTLVEPGLLFVKLSVHLIVVTSLVVAGGP